ncbi:MAG: hypothetical protein ACI4XB_02605 [Ruminococcus sp.]
MKRKRFVLTAIVLAVSLTACAADVSDTAETEKTTPAMDSIWEENETGEGANAIFYNGQRYYGLVMYSKDVPEKLEYLGMTAQSSTPHVYEHAFAEDTVPTEELQTNWTNGGVAIYAEYDMNGEITAFWTEPEEVGGETAYLGSVDTMAPSYYVLPDGEKEIS